ncbi:MAG: hypothetical protein EP343_07150 [Deltaproteobacteria bacterium]|nr:MAG: hypothetical protein EP343_07150 [Deltaproteobacteria bacterium]
MKLHWLPSCLFLSFFTFAISLTTLHCGTSPSDEVSADASTETAPTDAASTEDGAEATPEGSSGGEESSVAEKPTGNEEPSLPEQAPTEQPPEGSAGIALKGMTQAFAAGSAGPLLKDVEVCLSIPKGSCTKTDEKGAFELPGVPEDKNVLVSAEKETYFRTLYGFAAGEIKDMKGVFMNMLPKTLGSALVSSLGSQIKPGTGIVVMLTSGKEGINMKLDASGAEGPYFFSTRGIPDKNLKATTSSGIAFYINVPPGTQTITTSGSNAEICTHTGAWPGPNENEFLAKVEADSLTVLSITCANKVGYTGLTRNFLDQKPVEGVKVCLEQPKITGQACATTSATGNFQLPEFIEGKEMLLSMEKTGYGKVLHMQGRGQETHFTTGLLPSNMVPLFASLVGTQMKPGTGVIVVTTLTDTRTAAKGLTLSIDAKGAEGPFFLGTDGKPDPKLTGTTGAAIAFFVNVPPGVHTIKTTGEFFKGCLPYHAWEGTERNTFRAKVEGDALTYFSVRCERRAVVYGTASNFVDRTPLSGVKVCLEQPSIKSVKCATSNNSGYFLLSNVPLRSNMLFSIEKEGYMKMVQSIDIDQMTRFNPNLVPKQALPLLANAAGVQLKSGTGIVVVATHDRRGMAATDISMKLSATGAEGPFFIDSNGQPNTSLKGTSSLALAFFVNVPPGDHVVTTMGLHKQTCVALRAWPSTNLEEFKVKVQADTMFSLTVECTRERTRKEGESCLQTDSAKPEYNDCATDLICTKGTCATTLKRYSACSASTPCSDNHSCGVATNGQQPYCFSHCNPDRQDCPSDSFCMAYLNNVGRCLKKCSSDADCGDYGSGSCNPLGSVKICQ